MNTQSGDPVTDAVSEFAGSLVPGVGSVVRGLLTGTRLEWRRNASKALRAAETAAGMSREELAEWIDRDPHAIPLYLKVLWAAGMNGHTETLIAMGVVLGRAARASDNDDDGEFDLAELALRAMENLVPRHFRVLAVLADGEVGSNNSYSDFTPGHVAEKTSWPEDVAHQCLLNLAGAGLAYSLPVLGGTAYPITELGKAVIDAATAATEA